MNTDTIRPSGPECARYASFIPQLRHDALDSARAASLRAHLEGCPFCQARLAAYDQLDARLRSYARNIASVAPTPGAVVQAVLSMSTTNGVSLRRVEGAAGTAGRSAHALTSAVVPPEVRPMRFTRQHSLLATIAAMLVIVMTAALFATIAHLRGGPATLGPHPTPTSTIQPMTTTTVSPTRVITALQAWGANAAALTFDTQIDATRVFRASALSPDGTLLLGYQTPTQPAAGAQAQSGYFDIATRHFTAIGIAQTAPMPPNCCQTDGHYLLAALDTAPGATCGLCHQTYYSYDMVTGQLWQIAKGADYGIVQLVSIDHGIVLLSAGQGIYQADLAAHVVTRVQLPGGSSSDERAVSFAWPYLVYTVAAPNSATPATHAYNLATQADVALPQLDKLQGGGVATGDTLFLTQTANIDATHATTTLYEDDAFFSSSATPHAIAAYADQLVAHAANARLVTVYGSVLVWDRVEHRLVTLGAQGQQNDGVSLALSGHFLAVIQTNDSAGGIMPQHVTIYDTDTLPTALAA